MTPPSLSPPATFSPSAMLLFARGADKKGDSTKIAFNFKLNYFSLPFHTSAVSVPIASGLWNNVSRKYCSFQRSFRSQTSSILALPQPLQPSGRPPPITVPPCREEASYPQPPGPAVPMPPHEHNSCRSLLQKTLCDTRHQRPAAVLHARRHGGLFALKKGGRGGEDPINQNPYRFSGVGGKGGKRDASGV